MTEFQEIVVWKRDPTGSPPQKGGCPQHRVGTLRVKEPDALHGGLVGAFRYDRDYLIRDQAFPLDPLRLPLSPEAFSAHSLRAGVQGVFEDALPDDWGRALLIRRHGLSATHQRVPDLLLALGGNGLGALSFSAGDCPPCRSDPSATARDWETLVWAADEYERSGIAPADPALLVLLRAGAPPGGARPKALVREGDALYLAKFPSARDPVGVDMVRVEAASLALARQAGIETPETRVVLCAGRPVLLSRRFDVSPAGGRYHQISLQSLMGVEGYYHSSYAGVADVVRRVSGNPSADLAALYRRIVFHAALGHTDDHLKNIWMRHDGQTYRLAPAFDLAPDVAGHAEHVLSFGASGHKPTRTALAALGTVCGLRPEQATVVRREVMAVVRNWERAFAKAGIAEAERSRYRRDLDHRHAPRLWG